MSTEQTTGEKALSQTRESMTHGSLIDTIATEFGDKVLARVQKLGEENLSFFSEYGTDLDRFVKEVITPNWYAKAKAFEALANQYNMKEVDSQTDAETLGRSVVVGLTRSGSYVLLGPGASYAGSTPDTSLGNGQFSLLYIEGRQGNVTRRSGSIVPHQISTDSPYVGARVDEMPEAGKRMIITARPGENTEEEDKTTSPLLKVYYLEQPENVDEIFKAFGATAQTIDRQTLTHNDLLKSRPTIVLSKPEYV